MVNRKFAPGIKDAVELNPELKPFREIILDNGVQVYTIEAGAEDVLQLEIVFYAGNWYEEQNLVASAANFLLKNGTSQKSAFDINEHFEFYGSYLNRNCYNETATINLHCLTKHLPVLLPVMQEIITDSAFPQQELDIYKQNMKQRLQVNLKKCDFVANRLIDECLYGGKHPYGKYSSTIAYDALQREQLQEFFKEYYVNGRCVVFAAGRLPADLAPLLNRYIGKLPLNRRPLPEKQHPVEQAAEKKYNIINDPNGVQGAVRIGRHFPNRHHPDFLKVQVLNTLFGGFFGSRLMSNIREEKGYTYGIHSFLQNHIRQSAWMISTEAGRAVCEATVEEVYKEMQLLREGVIDEEELLLVKNYMMGTILGDLDGPFQIIGRWKNIILNNLDEKYFYNSIQTIKTITAAELTALAVKYLQPGDFYEMIVV
ncbi:MAG: pitrilysin family protein [Chitinophagaceae bacterium]|nr:pitrilysin family protein [Chitinophagaceae bacterium]